MIGKTLLHFKIIAKLGEGGMGVVYKAEDTKLKREVAIKFLPRKIAASEEERERFGIEAQAAAALNHNHISTIHSIEEVDGETFIVMEFIDGVELTDRIGADPISLADTLNLATQIAQGLQAAHEAGIVHRDIKPGNIMITENGQVKITDFGLAKVRGGSHITKAGTTLGTAAYMSPEQARGEETDHRSDIWAFGALLYEMISGQQPFKGDYEQAVVYSILNEEPPEIAALRPDVPTEIQAILAKALNKEPEARYQSAEEVLTDLIAAQSMDRNAPKPGKEKATPSIAVLPFVNQSADPENEYFSDGLAEEIINALTKLKNLQVAARTSSFTFKGKDANIQEIAKKLNVDHVLEGSVRKAGNRLRITAQLIKASDGYPIWSERFDRELDDVFAIQDEISIAIIDELKVQLLGEEKDAVTERGTEDLVAYELYLKGRYHWNQRGEGLRKGLVFFQQAVDKDPDYAAAHVGLSEAYALLAFYSILPPHQAMPKAKDAALEAIRIDDSLAEAYSALGFIATFYDWDWPSAKRYFLRALELNPRCVTAHYWYALHLSWVEGQHDRGVAQARRAVEIDPLGMNPRLMVSVLLVQQGKPADAMAELQQLLGLDSSSWMVYRYLAISNRALENHAESIKAGEQAMALSGRHQWTLADLGACYVAAGRTKETKNLMDELEARSKNEYVSPTMLGLLALELGNHESALRHFEQALEDRDGTLVVARFWPLGFPKILGDRRFEAILAKVGL